MFAGTNLLIVRVGYDDTRNAYRLFNPNINSVGVSVPFRFDDAAFHLKMNVLQRFEY